MLQDEEAIKFGQNGRSYVEATHDITKIIEQYKQIFLSKFHCHKGDDSEL
jgi:hypothetical protein